MPLNPDNQKETRTTGAAATSAQDDPLRTLERVLGETIPPILLQARESFRRDLPQLLTEHSRKWVAYSGDQRLGIGSSKTELYQECLRRGFVPGQFLVLSIEPELPREIVVSLDV